MRRHAVRCDATRTLHVAHSAPRLQITQEAKKAIATATVSGVLDGYGYHLIVYGARGEPPPHAEEHGLAFPKLTKRIGVDFSNYMVGVCDASYMYE